MRFLPFALALCAAPVFSEAQGDDVPSPVRVPDQPIEEHQLALIDLSFSGVSKMPLNPHVKNRARAQEDVITTCLELGQPHLALSYAETMTTWRQGAALADIAFHCAQRGQDEGLEVLLERAESIARHCELAKQQAWRLHRVLAKIARVHLVLGDQELADRIQYGLEHSEVVWVEEVRAQVFDPKEFDAHVNALDGVIKNGSFDQVKSALTTYSRLYERFYGDDEKRAVIEERVMGNRTKLPRMVGVELMLEFAGHALKHGDKRQGLALLEDGRQIYDEGTWTPDMQVKTLAGIAVVRHQLGQSAQAEVELFEARTIYEKHEARIANIYRADVLVAVAEAYVRNDDLTQALEVYAQAIEAGMVNPNSRPRSTNLAETLCSMASLGVEPNEEILARAKKIEKALAAPW